MLRAVLRARCCTTRYLFVVYHAITFANLTPQAMVVKVRGRKVPGPLMAASVYVGWLVVSAILAWLVLRPMPAFSGAEPVHVESLGGARQLDGRAVTSGPGVSERGAAAVDPGASVVGQRSSAPNRSHDRAA